MKSFKLVQILVLGLLAFSCSQNNRDGIDPRAEVRASSVIANSFKVETSTLKKTEGDLAVVDKAHVAISKAALNKEFLLSTNLLSQAPTPMFSSQQSRVVSFILRDEKVYLLDVTKNNVVGSGNIPQNLLIAEFTVLKDTGNQVVIDFNEGMKQIITIGDMFGSDDPGFSGADYKLATADVSHSYLDEVTLKDNALFIRQVAQVAVTTEKGTQAQPVEVRYQIKPYLPDSTFVPVKTPGFDKVGYFEANPLLLKDGSTRVYAMKWNEKKTIRFAVSANTPAKYRQLVKDSLLYWNKILGENAIEVTQLEDVTITAPHFDTNIVQWVDWDAAGYAFADAHVDPRSGEVTSAQIFFPSAFTEANVPKRIRLTEGSGPQIGLKGFKSARLCARDLLKDLENKEEVPATPEAMDKAMRDYVYEVIAHELGHVLGLRHNFAGNLAANYDFKDRKALIQSYYKNMKSPEGIVNSSSVMEYSRFEESSWNGDQFQNGGKALAYDQMAMEYLYFNKAVPATNRPLFCTDSHIAVYADCNMSDAGKSIVSSASGTYQFNLDSLAARLLNLYISKSKLADAPGVDLIPVSNVDLNAVSQVKNLGNDFAKLISLMKLGTKLIAVRSAKLPILSPDANTIKQDEKDYLAAEFNRLGGLEQLTQALPNDYDQKLLAKFSELLEKPLFNTGTDYFFSEAEKQTMKDQVSKFASQVKVQFQLNEIKALSGENFSFESTYGQAAAVEKVKWAASSLTEELAPILLKRFQLYALSAAPGEKLSSEITMKDNTVQKIELPVYLYPQVVRVASAKLLSNGHEAIEWGYVENNKLPELIKAEFSVLGDTDKIDMNALNKSVLKWYLNNKQVESATQN